MFVRLCTIALIFIAVLTPSLRAEDTKKSLPRQVLLIRHAEKPPDTEMSVDLSAEGRKRAEVLPDMFKKNENHPDPFRTPHFIFAAKDSKHSHRCAETVGPLAKKLQITVNADFANEDYTKLADEILNNPKYADKTILICWHHGTLQLLAEKLKAIPAPDHWKGTVFDRVWQITYDAPTKATMMDLPQRVLPMDSKK